MKKINKIDHFSFYSMYTILMLRNTNFVARGEIIGIKLSVKGKTTEMWTINHVKSEYKFQLRYFHE